MRRGLGGRALPEAPRADAHRGAALRVPRLQRGLHRRTDPAQAHDQAPQGLHTLQNHAGKGYSSVPQPGHAGGARHQHLSVRHAGARN